MQNILKMYYNIDFPLKEPGYFTYQNQLYYFQRIEDLPRFLDIYRCYCYMLQFIGCPGYRIVKNNNQNIVSHNYILIVYERSPFSLSQYLQFSLQSVRFQKIYIRDIKEQWIHKIDCAREQVKNYAYSFKHDQDMISLIYYYCGIAENSINILNHILSIDKNASIVLSLSLKYPIENYVYEILNPFHYTLSSRARHIVCLMKSQFLSYQDVQNIIETQYFDVFELIYLFARVLYPSTFFHQILNEKLNDEQIQSYYLQMPKERIMYQKMMQILSFYVTLPKISWINNENML